MYNTFGAKLDEHSSLFLISLTILFKYAFVNSIKLDNLRLVNIYDSHIHLIIRGKENQKLLNKDFQYEPSEVIVNGYKNNSYKKECYLNNEINKTIILIYITIS